MAGQQYASGNWTVKPGSEDEFVARCAKGLAACRELCDDFVGAHYSQGASV
jgi:hypothetical protein